MSFLTPGLHEYQRHAEYFLCRLQHGPTVCLACFLHSLADRSHLESQRIFTLREFMSLVSASDNVGDVSFLQNVLTQHASLVVNGFLQAMACTQDIGLAQALHEAAANMSQCAEDFLPELFTERLLQMLLELSWPQPDRPLDPTNPAAVQATAAVASCLQLLETLVSSHSSAAELLARILQDCEEAAAMMTGGLSCGVEPVVAPLLHIFSTLVNNTAVAIAAGAGGCVLAPGLTRELFLGLLLLLPDVSDQEFKLLVAQLLLRLAETGFAVEQLTQHSAGPAQMLTNSQSSQQQHNNMSQQQQQQQQVPASIIMHGLKVLLLDTSMQVQLLGSQVFVAVAVRAPVALLQQLIGLDVCEHVYEVLRGTLSSCSMKAKLVEAQIIAQQRKRGPESAAATAASSGVDAAEAYAAATEFEVVSEGLQSAAVAALRCLASQGHAFMEHFHCGLDPLIGLVQHATMRADSPLLADTLLLLRDITAPQQPSSLLLPAAALAKLVAAAAAVLPECQATNTFSTAASMSGCTSSWEQQQQQASELQPSPELQAAYECACDVITHVCMKYGSSSSSCWAAMQPHVIAGMHKALAAVSLLSSRSLSEGVLSAAARLAVMAAQQLLGLVGDGHHKSASLNGTEDPTLTVKHQAADAEMSKSAQRKPGGKGKQAAAAADNKPFAKQRRQQRQLTKTAATAAAGTTTPSAALAAHQLRIDDVLLFMESLLLHFIPAASRLFTGVSGELAAASASQQQQQQQQQEGAVFVDMLQAVQDVLMVVLSAGSCSPEVASFLPSFCSHLLSPPNKWCSVMLTIMEHQALPPAVVTNVWTVLLLAAANMEGSTFLAGIAYSSLPTLAANISKKATCNIHLLQLLCDSGKSQESAAATQAAPQSCYGRNSSRQAAALAAGAAGTSDIRRFCGLSELHRAALCIVAAAVRNGDSCWSWLDVLTALDAAVESAGPGVLSQSELLCNIVQLYGQVEQQLTTDLASEQLSIVSNSDGVLLTDWQEPQQRCAGTPGESAAAERGAVMQAVQQLPVPAAILHALQKLGKNIPNLQAGDAAAQWILARAAQLPMPVQQLLQRWMAALLSSSSSSSAATTSNTHSCLDFATSKQTDMSSLLVGQLSSSPAAVLTALQLAKENLENRQQLQLSGWLSILIGVLMHHISGSSRNLGPQPGQPASHQHYYLSVLSQLDIANQHRGAAGCSSNIAADEPMLLKLLLFGPSGLLELLRKALLACLSNVGSSIGSSNVVLACSGTLLAAIKALQKTIVLAASAAGGGSDVSFIWGSSTTAREAEEQLLQHGTQQVQLLATRLVYLPTKHPLRHQLLLAVTNTATALLHTGLLQQHDALLLQQLAECQELKQLAAQLAAAATARSTASQVVLSQSQQVEEVQILQCSQGEAEAAQLIRTILAQHNLLGSSAVARSAADLIDAGDKDSHGVLSSDDRALICHKVDWPISRQSLLLTALQYQQYLQLMILMGLLPEKTHYDVSGLNAQHMLLLAQNTRGHMLSVMLLHSLHMHLQQQARYLQAITSSETDELGESSDDSQWQQWQVILAVLQNMVTATAAHTLGSVLDQEALVSCLSSLYNAAAAALYNQSCHINGALMHGAVLVAKSGWNKAAIKAVLDRLCQSAVQCKARASEAEQAAALAAAADGQQHSATSTGSKGSAARLLHIWTSWLGEPDCQQQVQLLCADAKLLLEYIKLLLAVCQLERESNSNTKGSSNSRPNRQSLSKKLLGEFQQLIVPYLEQQQLVPVLCWAAARLCLLKAAAGNCTLHAQDHHVLSEYGGTQYQQQVVEHTMSASDGIAAVASQQYCLPVCLCDVALQVLAGLIDCGCFDGQLPWLHQQLQQQMWATSKLQQDYYLQSVNASGQLQLAGLVASAARSGALLSLGTAAAAAAAVADDQAIGFLRPCIVQLLLRIRHEGGNGSGLTCGMILDAIETTLRAGQQR